jgi:multiple sugar transport system permease protein
MLSPFIIVYSVFVIGPIILSIALSFARWDGTSNPSFVGVDNYREMLASRGFVRSFGNLLSYVALTVPIGIAVALGLALLVNRFLGRAGNFFRSVLFFPFIVPFFLTAAVWRWMFTARFGLVDRVLGSVGFDTEGWLRTPWLMIPALVVVDTWHSAGFNMVLILAGLKSISADLIEAARVDGARTIDEIRYVILPALFPVLFIVVVNGLISALQVFELPWLLTQSSVTGTSGGPGQRLQFPVMEMTSRGLGALDFGEASVIAVVLLVLTGVLTTAMFVARRRFGITT